MWSTRSRAFYPNSNWLGRCQSHLALIFFLNMFFLAKFKSKGLFFSYNELFDQSEIQAEKSHRI